MRRPLLRPKTRRKIMRFWKTSLITAVSAIGLLAAPAAQAHDYYYRPTTVARPVFHRMPRYRTYWYRGRWVRRPIYVQPIYQYQAPVYSYQEPTYSYQQQPAYSYQQPTYDNGCNAFAEQVRAELTNIEEAVRARVANGELDGNALTAMES